MFEGLWVNPFSQAVDSEPILRDVFTDWDTGAGLFSFLAVQGTMPWAEDEDVDSTTLDIAYFGNHSGGKYCSPLVKYYLVNGAVPSANRTKLAKVIVAKYLRNWNALWATTVAEYDPVHNYNMYEERDLTTTEDEETVTDGTLVHSGTNSTEHGMVETTAHGLTNDTVLYKFGLNTADNSPRPSDKQTYADSGSTVVTDSGTDTNRLNLQDKNDVSETVDNDGTEHEETHRYGNIGVTTTQQMLESERKLRMWNFFDTIFNNLDKELALMYFDPCRV